MVGAEGGRVGVLTVEPTGEGAELPLVGEVGEGVDSAAGGGAGVRTVEPAGGREEGPQGVGEGGGGLVGVDGRARVSWTEPAREGGMILPGDLGEGLEPKGNERGAEGVAGLEWKARSAADRGTVGGMGTGRLLLGV